MKNASPRSMNLVVPSISTTTHGAGRGQVIRRSVAGNARLTAAERATRSSFIGPKAFRPRAKSRAVRAPRRSGSDVARRARRRATHAHSRRYAVSRSGAIVCPHVRRCGRRDRHLTQYFEMMGHRSIYHDGWRAVARSPVRLLPKRVLVLGRWSSMKQSYVSSTLTDGSSITWPMISRRPTI